MLCLNPLLCRETQVCIQHHLTESPPLQSCHVLILLRCICAYGHILKSTCAQNFSKGQS